MMAGIQKFRLFALIILLSTFISESTQDAECKKPWVSIGTGCYNFESLLLSIELYSDAVKLCPSGSHPVDIGSKEELEILSRIVRDQLPRIVLNGIWTSGSRTTNLEDYYWEIGALGKKKGDYFAWLNEDVPLQNRKNHLALAFDDSTSLLGYIDVDSKYPTGFGVVCKAVVCPPPICEKTTKCIPLVDPNGCAICSNCGGKDCKVELDVEEDGATVCTTCYCKKDCDDVEKCLYGCHLVSRQDGCPKCECPAVIVPLDVRLKFTEIVPSAGELICQTVDKLIQVSEVCNKTDVGRCTATSDVEDQAGRVTVTVGIVTLSIRTSYTNFFSVMNQCKDFLDNSLISEIGKDAVQNVFIEVPNYMPIPPPVTQSTCLKQKRNLPCNDANKVYELRWEFDSRTGHCRPYVHNGCQDDEGNSFPTMPDCLTTCSGARCFLPRNPGGCKAFNNRWTFNPYTGMCEQFVACEYGGNSNSFPTERKCYAECRKAVCAEPEDVGPCTSMSVGPRYHYDSVTKECNMFNWGGCFGNGNNYESYDNCKGTCNDLSVSDIEEETTTSMRKATTSPVKTTPTAKGLLTVHQMNREKPCVCTVDGDPKVTTFDGSPLLIDGVGIYLLLKTEHPDLGERVLLAVGTVQADPGEYPGLLSIARIYFKSGSQLTIVERNSILIDGVPVTVLPTTFANVTITGVIGDHVNISLSAGHYVTVKFGMTPQDTHVLFHFRNKVFRSLAGLCGNCDGDRNNEFFVDSEDLSKDPQRFHKISRFHLIDLDFILSND